MLVNPRSKLADVPQYVTKLIKLDYHIFNCLVVKQYLIWLMSFQTIDSISNKFFSNSLVLKHFSVILLPKRLFIYAVWNFKKSVGFYFILFKCITSCNVDHPLRQPT